MLGRGGFTHEFAGDKGFYALQEEYEGKRVAPTFKEIVAMLPAEKVVVLGI